MRIEEIMTRAVFTIEPHHHLDEAAHRMHAAAVRHLVVVERGCVVGVLSDRDVERIHGLRHAGIDEKWTVADAMTSRVITAAPETSLRHAAQLLRAHVVDCLPVVEGKELVGIVTTSDLLEVLSRGKDHAPPASPPPEEHGVSRT